MSQAGKVLYLVANWKSHKSLTEAMDWCHALKTQPIEHERKVIVCPPFPYLIGMSEVVRTEQVPVEMGVQDVSSFPLGAYTGAVAASMVSEWVKYAIVGHSERRRYFHETDQDVANKVSQALEANLKPIVCVDEPYLESQIETIEDTDYPKLIFAYEPLAAIGSGHPDTPQHADEVAQRIQAATHHPVPVLYGGSVTPENIKAYTDMPNIGGALVGGASLDPEIWKQLVGSV